MDLNLCTCLYYISCSLQLCRKTSQQHISQAFSFLQDEGMLPDAYLNSLQGKEYGQEFIRKNAHFLTDYFHYRCREKDFD